MVSEPTIPAVDSSAAANAAPPVSVVVVVEQAVDEIPAVSASASRRRTDLRSLKRGVLTILVLLVLAICAIAQEILVPIVLALLLSLLLSPVVSFLERVVRLPRFVGSLLTLAALVAALVYGALSLKQPAQEWIASAPQTMQTIQQRFHSIREPIRQAQEASKKIEELTQPAATPATVVTAQPSLLSNMAMSTPHALGEIAAVLLLIYFFLSSGNDFLRNHFAAYEEKMTAAGRTYDRLVHRVVRDVIVADTDAEARALAIDGGIADAWREYIKPTYERFGVLKGLLHDPSVNPDDVDGDYLCEHVWIVGSVETVRQKLNAWMDDLGGAFGTLLIYSHDYIDNPEPWERSMELLVKEVAPHVGTSAMAATA